MTLQNLNKFYFSMNFAWSPKVFGKFKRNFTVELKLKTKNILSAQTKTEFCACRNTKPN